MDAGDGHCCFNVRTAAPIAGRRRSRIVPQARRLAKSRNHDKLGQMHDPRKYAIRGHSTTVESDPSFRKMARELVVCPTENADWLAVYVNSAVVEQLREGLMKIERERERDAVTLSYQPTASALIARRALNR
jgi:hypothetical protein